MHELEMHFEMINYVDTLFFISSLLYHQSFLDYKYTYVDGRKWQYKT